MNEQKGVGPHRKPWPKGPQYDEDLLLNGDSRNVVDKYHYWKVKAIKADLDKTRQPLEVAIENWQHDFNIGTIVRNANAFNARKVHIIGRHHWNKRGAMVTDVYMNIEYHPDVASFMRAVSDKNVIGVDNVEGAENLGEVELTNDCVLVFGGEGPGLSAEMVGHCERLVQIEQFGSTRSVNVGVASGIIMYAWLRQHALTKTPKQFII